MGANKESAIEQSENFYSRLDENEEYANVSCKLYMLDRLKMNGGKDVDYVVHNVKQNNPLLREDENLKKLYSKKRKLNKEITEMEQNINHNNKKS